MKFYKMLKDGMKVLLQGSAIALIAVVCVAIVISQADVRYSTPAPQVVQSKPDVRINKGLKTVAYRQANVNYVIEQEGGRLVIKSIAYFPGRGAMVPWTRDADPNEVQLWQQYFSAS